jgi:hypothetical protein
MKKRFFFGLVYGVVLIAGCGLLKGSVVWFAFNLFAGFSAAGFRNFFLFRKWENLVGAVGSACLALLALYELIF